VATRNAARIDHIERVYRKEEQPLLAQDYEVQQKTDCEAFATTQPAESRPSTLRRHGRGFFVHPRRSPPLLLCIRRRRTAMRTTDANHATPPTRRAQCDATRTMRHDTMARAAGGCDTRT
jgi:hypothetical protein